MRVGLPLDALETRFCPGCGSFVDHVLSCHMLGIYTRHIEARNKLASLCSNLSLHVKVEKGPEGSLLRPDVLVQGPLLGLMYT